MNRFEVIARLHGERGPLQVSEDWAQIIQKVDDPAVHEILIKTPRQWGKSQLAAGLAISETLLVPNSYVVLVSASKLQATAIFQRKLKGPVQALLRQLRSRQLQIRWTNDGFEVPALNSALEILAPDSETTPGRSITKLILDEGRYISDETYGKLIPSVLASHGKILALSTPGQPKGWFYASWMNPTPNTFKFEALVNTNPHADTGLIATVKQRLALILPHLLQTEILGVFADQGDTLIPGELIDARIDDFWRELLTSKLEITFFYDLAFTKDLCTRIGVAREAPRVPEASDHLTVVSLKVWNPAQCPNRQVPFEDVRADLADLPKRFPNTAKILVDAGSQAGSVMPFARSQPSLCRLVEEYVPTLDNNMAMWSALVSRLHAGTISLPREPRLLAELHALKVEASGAGKWKVVDASRKLHRDLSLSLAGACFAMGQLSAGQNMPVLTGHELATYTEGLRQKHGSLVEDHSSEARSIRIWKDLVTGSDGAGVHPSPSGKGGLIL